MSPGQKVFMRGKSQGSYWEKIEIKFLLYELFFVLFFQIKISK